MKVLDVIAAILLVVGGLNWGLVGLFQFDLVAAIFGDLTILSRIIYTLVGIAALYQIVTLKHTWEKWTTDLHTPAHA